VTGSSPGHDGVRAIWPSMAFCLVGVALFSAMDALMKGAALGIGTHTALLWRSVIASAMGGTLFLLKGNRWPSWPVLRVHVVRGLVIAPMVWLFFWSLTRLPLAEAIGLSFIAPVIALYLSALMLHEKVNRNSILAALLGLAGVAVIVSGRMRGGYDAHALLGAAALLASAVLFAINLVLQRQQALLSGPVEIVFFQNGIVLLALLPFTPADMGVPDARWWPHIAGSAVLTIVSQMALARAYAHAPANRLIPLEYSAFIWASLFGWFAFEERLTGPVLIGAALIIVACFVTARERPLLAARTEPDTV